MFPVSCVCWSQVRNLCIQYATSVCTQWLHSLHARMLSIYFLLLMTNVYMIYIFYCIYVERWHHANAWRSICIDSIIRICFWMLRTPFECFEFGFESFESLSNGKNLHTNASNLVRRIRIFIWMLWILFEWLEFAFECFEYLSNGLNIHSNASNPFRRLQMCIRMPRIPSNGLNLHSNASNPFRMFRIPFESLSNVSNPFRMLRIPFE